MIFLPPIASIVLFLFVWWQDLLARPYLFGALVLIGVAAQFLAHIYSPAWFAAAIFNVCFAIYFAIRLKLA